MSAQWQGLTVSARWHVLANKCFPLSSQPIHSFYTGQRCIMHRSRDPVCLSSARKLFSPIPLINPFFLRQLTPHPAPLRESVRPSSAWFFCFPHATPTPLTADPLSMSVLAGEGFVFVTLPPSRTSYSISLLILSFLVGVVVVDTCPPS